MVLTLIFANWQKNFKNFLKDGKEIKIITVGSKGHDQIKTEFGKYIIEKKALKKKTNFFRRSRSDSKDDNRII